MSSDGLKGLEGEGPGLLEKELGRARGDRGRMLGCVLGFFSGALIGWTIGLWGYFAWADSSLTNIDFYNAVDLALERALPGLVVGAAIGGAAWRRRRGLVARVIRTEGTAF